MKIEKIHAYNQFSFTYSVIHWIVSVPEETATWNVFQFEIEFFMSEIILNLENFP